MSRVDVTRKAAIHVRCGSSGSGKSWGVKLDLKRLKASRVIIFDPDDEYGDVPNVVTVLTAGDLIETLKRFPRGGLKIRYVANGSEAFDLWSRAAFAWGNCVAVAEELAGVTSPNKAPHGWHTLVSRGRKRGIIIYAVMQRPAECDKTVIGNATTIRAGRMTRDMDRRYIANETGVDRSKYAVLQPLEFIEVDMTNSLAYQGKVNTKQRRKLALNH